MKFILRTSQDNNVDCGTKIQCEILMELLDSDFE